MWVWVGVGVAVLVNICICFIMASLRVLCGTFQHVFYYFLLPSPQVISAFIDVPFKKRGKGRWRFFLLFLPSFLFLLQ